MSGDTAPPDEAKRPVGRPTKYDPAYCDDVEAEMGNGLSLTAFAGVIGVSRSTINEWIDANPEFSEAVSAKVDGEVSRLINDGLKTAQKVLEEHQKAFTAVALKLIEVETLEQEDYEKILTAHGIMLKKKEEAKVS